MRRGYFHAKIRRALRTGVASWLLASGVISATAFSGCAVKMNMADFAVSTDLSAIAQGGTSVSLSFSVAPSATGTAGSALAAQPEIQILDIFGDPVPGATDAVTLEAFTDAGCTTPASGTLSAGTNPLTAAGGVAAFNGVSYTKAETIYLRASSGTLTSACSGPIAIGAGAATTFAFSTQPPATASSNVNFSTQPVVTFYDAHGNVATGAANAVTLSAYTNAGCTVSATGTLSATTNPQAASNGVATFAGVKYAGTVGNIYLKAAAAGFTDKCSSVVNVGAGLPAEIRVVLDQWYKAPSTCTDPIRIRLYDGSGNQTTANVARTVNLTDRILPANSSNSTTGSYYTASNCSGSAVTSVAFAAGESEKVVYYRDTTAETVRVRATSTAPTAITEGSADLTIGTALAFSAMTPYIVAGTPTGIDVGDLNGDGYPDIAVSVSQTDRVNIFLNDGDGTFTSGNLYTTGDGPATVRLVYLDGPTDTTLDLVVASLTDDDIRYRRGNGNGTFGGSSTLAMNDLDDFRVADVNGDGYMDLILDRNLNTRFTVRLNDQSGGFGPEVHYTTASNIYTLTDADLDGDGDIDIVVTVNNGNNIYRYFNNGAGVFTQATDPLFNGTSHSTSLTGHFQTSVGDLNGDGLVDFLYVGYTSNTMGVSLGNGAGTDATWGTTDDFQSETSVMSSGLTSYRPYLGDFDGDGDLDVAFPANGSQLVKVARNNGSGGFTSHADYSQNFDANGSLPRAIVAADLNGDGELDLVVQNTNNNAIGVMFGVPQ